MGHNRTHGRHGRGSWTHSPKVATLLAVAGIFALGFQAGGPTSAGAATRPAQAATDGGDVGGTGFTEPFAGAPQYLAQAPTQIGDASEINQALGAPATAAIAQAIGLTPEDTFTHAQYVAFLAGKGLHGTGDPASAKLFDQSVKILTNTADHPLYYSDNGKLVPTVVASYGLFVTTDGELESPAYKTAPTRVVNDLIKPGGYMAKWCRVNGAGKALDALYKSAYTAEASYGFVAQSISGDAQLIDNVKGGVRSVVGMSMGPALWVVNFALLYMLNPELAAEMPAKWAPIPTPVADALRAPANGGHVPYSKWASYFG